MFEQSADQQLFAETTRKFLESECPSPMLRELGRTESGYEPDLWRRGADLGWTSLVVPEDAGGGSVSESGILDLVLLAFEFGTHAAPGPLLPTNLVGAALGRWGSAEHKSGPSPRFSPVKQSPLGRSSSRRRTTALARSSFVPPQTETSSS